MTNFRDLSTMLLAGVDKAPGVCNIISGEDADLQLLGLIPGAYNSMAGMSPYPVGAVFGAMSPFPMGVDGSYNALAAGPMHAMLPHAAHPAFHRPAPVFHPAAHHPAAYAQPIARIAPSHPGTPQPGMRWLSLPLLASAFTAASGTALPFAVTPQHYFKGRRWIYVETRTGATATGLVTLLNPAVGTHIQLVAAGSTSAAQYAPTAFDTDESLDPMGPGVTLSGTLVTSAAPAMTDRIDFNLAIKGETLA